MREIKLGDIVTDSITKFSGVVTAVTQYLNGCVQVLIQPKKLNDDGSPVAAKWLDAEQLIVEKEKYSLPTQPKKIGVGESAFTKIKHPSRH